MNAPSSLWTTLDKKAQVDKKSSFNVYTTLSTRSKLENERPHRIQNAQVEKLTEKTLLVKPAHIEEKRSFINATYYVLKNPNTNEYFRVDEKERFLWNHMDGTHTIRDLALEYFNQYGAFAYDKIIELVLDLKKQTFLKEQHVDIYSNISLWKKSTIFFPRFLSIFKQFFYWDFPIYTVDAFFSLLYTRIFHIFFGSIAQRVLIALGIVGFIFFLMASRISNHIILQHNDSFAIAFVILYLSNILSLFFHELAHGVATKHYDRHVHKAGFLLYFGIPSFYVDTTDMWMEEKEKRIMVSIIGPFTAVLTAGVVSMLFFVVPPGLVSSLMYKFAFISYVSVFMNLNPLLEWDGYFMLMDMLGIPCLRKRSLHFLRHGLYTKLYARKSFSREEKIYTVFGILIALWSVFATLLALNFWRHQILTVLTY